jgi:hypothetical protein
MKKQLNTATLENELSSGSAFFRKPSPGQDTPKKAASSPPPAKSVAVKKHAPQAVGMPQEQPKKEKMVKAPPPPAVMEQTMQAGNLTSKLASYQASMIETIRKSVKGVGREVTFVRLTREEKNQVKDIVYTYHRQGVKTSENEVSRIAINLLVEDYKTSGEESVLARVLAALLA